MAKGSDHCADLTKSVVCDKRRANLQMVILLFFVKNDSAADVLNLKPLGVRKVELKILYYKKKST